MTNRLLSWFIFSFLIGVIPIVFSFASLLNKGLDASLTAVIGKGELFIFIAAISAGAIGELFSENIKNKTSAILAGGATLIILLLTALQYADIYAVTQLTSTGTKQPDIDLIDPNQVVFSSIFFLIFGTITSACCIGISFNARTASEWR